MIDEQLDRLRRQDHSQQLRGRPRHTWPEDVQGSDDIFWQIPPVTERLLAKIISEVDPQVILELGTSAGFSGLVMLKHSIAHLHTIEFNDYRLGVACDAFAKAGVADRVTIYSAKIEDILDGWNEPVDFVFIDAHKAAYLENFRRIEPYLTSKAVIVADNMLDEPEKNRDFLRYARKHYDCDLISVDNGVLIIRR